MTTRNRPEAQSLEEAYFEWLAPQAQPARGRQTYYDLHTQLFHREFYEIVPNDDNRIADGLELLGEFWTEMGLEVVKVEGRGCSFLELVIGLSRRLSFIAGGDPIAWAWVLLGNLGFHSISDPMSKHAHRFVEETCERVIYRRYQANGVGGFFPLHHPQEDQRKVELWYQMNAYAEENPID